jgi:hypothetical protein
VNVLELLHLFRVEYMECAIELSQRTVFEQGVPKNRLRARCTSEFLRKPK